MAKRAQGTQLYIIDPDDDSIIEIECLTEFNGPDTTNEQLETTCLADAARTFIAGLATPGQASLTLLFDPSNASHVRVHALKVAKADLAFALGWSDGTAPPTFDTDGVFDLPTSRTFITFDGFFANLPWAFGINGIVTSAASIQVSGEPGLYPKTA